MKINVEEENRDRITKLPTKDEKKLKKAIFEWIKANKKISKTDKERLLTTFTF